MANEFVLSAEPRTDAGKGASRRLRREGKVPAILYGGKKKAESLALDHNEIWNHLKHEAFHSHVLHVNIKGKMEQAILKDVQAHPFKPEVLHLDLQRVSAKQEIRMEVPIHFIGEDSIPGVKAGGIFSRNLVEVEIACLPKDLPEYLELDVSGLGIGDSLHLSDIELPKGVEIVALAHGDTHEHDLPVVAVHHPRVSTEEEQAAAAEAEGAEAPGAEQAPTPAESETPSE